MTVRLLSISAFCIGALAIAIAAVGCEAPNPHANTPTSGRLVVYADEGYGPLLKALADTFMIRSPNAKVEVRQLSARMAVQSLLDAVSRDTNRTDTGTTYAIVVGRKLLPDEQEAMTKGGIDIKEYVIAWDGLSVVVPNDSPIKQSSIERLRATLASAAPTLSMLDSTAGAAPLRFILPDQYSSTYSEVQRMLKGAKLAAPANYFSTTDSVLAAVASGNGIGLLGWLPAHRDSARTRTLALGFTDSLGKVHPAAIVHPTSLVTGAYPVKQPLVGYTYAATRSLAVGFMAWLSKGQDAQYYIARHGLQPENVKIRIVLPDDE
jgi:phosphate transport system substrate-binding protein